MDAGLIRLHFRARPGCGWKRQRGLCDEVERVLRSEIPKDELQTVLDNIGLPNSGINLSYSRFGRDRDGRCGDFDCVESGAPSSHGGVHSQVAPRACRAHFPGVEFFFQPADIVSQILNFGLPAPIDIQIVGAECSANYDIAQQIANRVRQIPGTADVHVQQMLSLPTLHLDMDRTASTRSG